MQLDLAQRGRASVDFVAAVGGASAQARRAVDAELRASGFDAGAAADPLPGRCAAFDAAVRRMPAWPAFAAVREWVGANHGRIAMEAFDEVRATVEPRLRALEHGPTTLEATLGDDLPDYFRGVAFHRTGSWDAHDFMGAVHGEIVHRRLVGRNFGGDIYAQRRDMLAELARPSYARILEIGVSSGNYTVALSQRFPRAEITGIDLSLRMLEHAQRIGNELGQAWRLYQRAGEATGFEAGSFDLVTYYSLGHELPERALRALLREAWRVLAPGGEILFGDVIPYLSQDPLAQAWADHEARTGGEPYWREYCSLDLALCANEAGFERARYFQAKTPRRFPFILHAFKGAASAATVGK